MNKRTVISLSIALGLGSVALGKYIKGPAAQRQSEFLRQLHQTKQERLAQSILICDADTLEKELRNCLSHSLFTLHTTKAVRAVLNGLSGQEIANITTQKEYSPYFAIGKGLQEFNQEKYLKTLEVLLQAGVSVDRGTYSFRKQMKRAYANDPYTAAWAKQVLKLIDTYQPR